MTRPAVSGLVLRGAVIAAAAVIVVIGTLTAWPLLPGLGPDADSRRVADLQRLSHAVEVYRAQHDVLPATLVKLPANAAAPIHTFDPVSNRPYDYRPLGPLAYELCARFDAALADEARDFWWHDAGRQCFALEMKDTRPRPAPVPVEATAPGEPVRADPVRGDDGAPPPSPAPEGGGAAVTPP